MDATAKYIRVRDVARTLGLSERAVRLAAAEGRLPAVRVPGGVWLFELQAVEAALRTAAPARNAAEAHETAPAAPGAG